MKVLISGATGLLGGALMRLMVREGYEVRCLLRPESPNAPRLNPEAEVAYGDAGDADALAQALQGVDAFVHATGIEYAPQVSEALRSAGVDRLVAVSSTSAHSSYPARSGPKLDAEAVVRGSGLSWTIVRPAMIYGSELDRNMRHLLRFLDRSPVFPIFGSGENLWQPVYYEDLARGTLEALTRPQAVGQTYDLPGSEPLTYAALVRTAAAALGRKPRLLRVPLEPVRRVLRLAEAVRLPLPVASEQVLRLREDKAYPYDEARRDLGYSPRPFEEGIRLQVARLRELGMVRP